MLGKGVSREHFQPRTCSMGKNASKTGRAKGDLENIVYIDLDCDQFDDVEIIDCSDDVLQKLRGFSGQSRDRTSTPQSVISIDDDDDDDESDDVDHSGIDVDGVGELDSDASSNKRFSMPSSVRNSVRVDVDDCDVYEKDSVSKRQKSKGVFSSKTALRNRYGLYGSEFESSDSDCSDCEVIKREQWEKVSAKRKGRVINECASSSGLHGNNYNNIEVENRSQRHGKGPLYGPSSSNYVKENRSSFTVKDDIRHGERTTREKVYPCPKSKNFNFCNGVTGSSGSKNELGDEESTRFKDDIQHGERTTREKVSGCLNSENSKGHEFELHTQDGDLTASNEKNIINEKERHKETDLYKKAMEEELASRQRALQIQAEEAQKERRRKKAKNSQLLDIERRSKERLEEDEELMNTKDKLRDEIKKKLGQLERQCPDMTSLLRGLGIKVGESLRPSPNEASCVYLLLCISKKGREVQAAYKRAMFKFHPDRASKTDISTQVEAEETFKLISRMKEKFCLTSGR
ncbi:hypothetical protein TSUD_217590 [Trifolium subterraneum]|uniref:J domain-containing protein n=1 Tax=Trifolium subterraneum TaxID=3900 RepID=A0A2Z6NS15_TRISU|nr:hypothetical protein TSUD_217590 [Trifolium subterraneum]